MQLPSCTRKHTLLLPLLGIVCSTAVLAPTKAGASSAQWPDAAAKYSYLRAAWETSGRAALHSHSGLTWDDSSKKWVVDPHWDKDEQLGHEVYDLETPLRGAVEMGSVCHDLPLLNEVAQFLVALSSRF